MFEGTKAFLMTMGAFGIIAPIVAPKDLTVPLDLPKPMPGPANVYIVAEVEPVPEPAPQAKPPTPTEKEKTVSLMKNHPLYDLTCRRLLKQHGGEAILANPEAFQFFKDGLPTLADPPAPGPGPAPVPPPAPPAPSGHPILDAIKALVANLLANPQTLMAFIQMIIALFPKG